MSKHSGPPGQPDQPQPGERDAWLSVAARKNRRRRVVLADPRGRGRVLRTIIELEEQTSVGEKLIRDLIRQQLKTAFLLGGGTLTLLALLPLVFYFVPALSGVELAGVRLPWLILGVVPFPLCYAVGYAYRRLAERHEHDFVSSVDR
ncbi:hypothetical protein ABZ816_32880 [Actinosynnema sp. NPDC047251]|uniref:Putative membrane protein n=1 Tax=Saccharothrix espanaensis (strain ATCC 51144 / DSM 44229 / JCM 9112 / NBRC 15066 / NRRL 15764) TaxID=1179773 RepID=K0JPR6_SACES|nr:hypothetical protein [Saccharothrix espanaensis]CCH27416.1 putative membrane protein [Saccharothrix espanaensis DSM 44229]